MTPAQWKLPGVWPKPTKEVPTMLKGTQVRCEACNAFYTHPGRRSRWCSPECTRAMSIAAAMCNYRLRAVNRHFDQICNHCGKPLGPVDVVGIRKLPPNRGIHPECRKSRADEAVGSCSECGGRIRRRDGDTCNNCARALARRRQRVARGKSVATFYVDSWSYRDRLPCLINSSPVPVSRIRRHLLKKQGGVCALCGNGSDANGFHLDHDHGCDHHDVQRVCSCCIRGVLCRRCNNMLAYSDDPDWWMKVHQYTSR